MKRTSAEFFLSDATMQYFTGAVSKPKWASTLGKHEELGMLLSPKSWRTPHSQIYACDNDVFAHSFIGPRPNPDFWKEEGEANWLKMLDKLPLAHAPRWIVLPDVVGDWAQTIDRAWLYRERVESRGLKCALVLQDGCNWKEAWDFAPDCLFVGGTTYWKWSQAPSIVKMFRGKIHLHLGRVNGERAIRLARKMGFDSADGTGLCRFTNAVLPGVLAGLRADSSQPELF